MNGTTWMRSGPNSPAHWIKLSSSYFTTACRKIISKDKAERIKVEKVGIAGAPGQYIYKLEDSVEMCAECAQKVTEQA